MQQWIKCILVFTWKMAVISAQCPGFTCSGSSCYLIYPAGDQWKYNNPYGDIKNADVNVYTSPNCYKYIRVNKRGRSCIDAQRECELVGGNITVINSIAEYNQLIENVIHILRAGQNSEFSVHVQEPPLDDIRTGCATIRVEDGNLFSNIVRITNIECATTRIVDTILCESTDVNKGICPVTTNEVKQTTMPTSTTSVQETRTIYSFIVNQPIVTDEGTAEYTYTSTIMHRSKENQSEIDSGLNILVVVILSSIVVTIAIILLSFLLIRCRQRGQGQEKPVHEVQYQDYVAEDVHEYATHDAVIPNHATTAYEAAYQHVKDNNDLYHDTAAAEVVYHDTAAVEVVYHDTAVVGVYQNSDVGRGKRTKVTSSPDRVDIPYENTVRTLGSRGRGKGK